LIVAIQILAAVQLVAIAGVAAVLIGRRLQAARSERRRDALLERFRDAVIEFTCTEDAEPPALLRALRTGEVREAVGTLLTEHAGWVKGDARRRLTAFMVEQRYVDASVAELRAHRDWRRGQAAKTLGDFGSDLAVEALLRALRDDPSPRVRAAAGRALGRIGDARAAEPVLAAWEAGRLPAGIAAQSLLDVGPPALPALVGACSTATTGVRAMACRAIGHVGFADRDQVLDLLGQRAIADPAAEVRGAACTALGQIGGDESAFVLAGAMGDTHAHVRQAASDAVARLRIAELEPLTRRLMDDPEPEVARAAARAVVVLAGRETADGNPFAVEAAAELEWGWA
jgi:HEAT repeat protein